MKRLIVVACSVVSVGCGLAAVVGMGTAGASPHVLLPPTVSSVSVVGYPLPAAPTVTVTGANFGGPPRHGVSPSTLSNCGSGTGLDYPKSQLWLIDASRSGGLSGAFQEGQLFTPSTGNCGGIIIESWTKTQAQFTFGSRYASDGNSLQSGDSVCVDIKEVPACTQLS